MYIKSNFAHRKAASVLHSPCLLLLQGVRVCICPSVRLLQSGKCYRTA